MGWLYSYDKRHDKAAQVAEFRAPGSWSAGTTLLADRVVGNHYWAALQLADGKVTIILALMRKGGPDCGYGYKLMDETVHPYYYDCPLSLLKMATDPPYNENAAEWRAKVREYHAQRAHRPKPQAGLEVTLAGVAYRLLGPAGLRRGWNVERCSDHVWFRMNSRQLSRALAA